MITNTTAMMTWISPATMHSLGWALLHFLWQGTALAALAAAAMALSRRASLRYVVGLGALVLMLLAPVATFFYSQDHPGQGPVLVGRGGREGVDARRGGANPRRIVPTHLRRLRVRSIRSRTND